MHKASNQVLGICRPLLNQKHNVEWFVRRSFVDLVQVYFLLYIGRNHSNTFLWTDLQETKKFSKLKYYILAGFDRGLSTT